MSRYPIALALLLGTTILHAGEMPLPDGRPPGGPMTPPPPCSITPAKGVRIPGLGPGTVQNIDAACRIPATRSWSACELPPQPLKTPARRCAAQGAVR